MGICRFTMIVLALLVCRAWNLNQARVLIGTDYYHNRGYKGAGVICGIVDDVDITFNDFRDPITHETRVLAYKRYWEDTGGVGHWDIWDKTRIDSLLNADYPYDAYHYYDSASVFHNRRNNHGTVIANIMAGNGTSLKHDSTPANFIGIAPESKLVIVSKAKDSCLYYIDSVARSHNMPWSANLSWVYGPEAELNALTGQGKRGRAAFIASGNDNFRNFRRIAYPANDTIETMTFGLDTLSNLQVASGLYFYMSVFNILFSDTSKVRVRFNSQYGASRTFTWHDTTAADSLIILYSFGSNVYEGVNVRVYPGERQKFWYEAQSRRTTNWSVDLIKTKTVVAETVDIAFSWETNHYHPYGILPHMAFDTSRYTLVEFPLAQEAIIVGGNYFRPINDTIHGVGEICDYSSVGPTFDNRMRPDVVAPSHGITTLAVENDADTNSILGTVWMGTSFSSPMAAGAAALLLQEDSTRDAADIRQILHERAQANAYTGELPNTVYGWGVLNIDPNPTPVVNSTVGKDNGPWLSCHPNPFNPVVTIAGGGQWAAGSKVIRLEIYDLHGKLIYLLQAASRQLCAGITWEASSQPSGMYIVRVQNGKKVVSSRIVLVK
ncbi:MAG: hypothetical protein A2268_00735 [Candidatus Raymondbacteria bacterium RifOxyA12_full_50_37]|uniref:Peptidase S8/S53 domain-containing protein n=1 Tax=Candidatus Raymondbacteria bacterium RIFOXYD12_FULL_49_13 TaxID=1817890 RepID=A0A1F7F1M2_UNCRA|nr:MAG: hypothetical protein A2268_00735 [Candidatus Raymondbacteria bacterium RifOxyA12_full_50_37]OGJ90055.1 MAG: hypothetical protein A2248_19065 [Candidatus Raymondbacteria bacterium RIFOXYA2_FULL_49_16]OGJ92872.1 MAG: hypothetical protein A2487_09630 [Candidatus Raymondbacteria bacterium RifOxyC12_full_50_8]OGJ96696.1 MAG: hypothetical protein A2350_01920 [Candidatus Raymondbacteria bacterium RifOxyB12_full_50_8]OGJ96739.1 MAG: hypothetical protein A2453_06190 [Candidatus Raymondbacteria b